MSSWGDTLTEQVGGDISIDRQHVARGALDNAPAAEQYRRRVGGAISAFWGRMTRSL